MRQRIIDAIRHKDGCPVPWNIEITEQFADNLRARTGCADCEAFLKNHMRRIKYKKNRRGEDGREVDLFGVTWMRGDDGGDVGVVAEYPLQHMSVEDYVFPEIDVDFAHSVCEKLEADTSRFTMFSITMGFFERAWSLMGMEDVLVNMAMEEDDVRLVYDGILEHHLKLLDVVLPHKFDALFFGDDWGQQNGLIMGPKLWRQYIKPGVAKIFEKARSAGKMVVLHSCGDLREIMGDLIEIGVDVYNTVQPEIYDLKELKREYGKDLTFYGGISTQQFLPTATRAESKGKAREVLDIMADGGGYILSPTHAVTPDIPVDNILAIIEAGEEYNAAIGAVLA
ncbi:MAG: uroporphyrinogen decarboxylase [Planctomycetes bacterium]|nr:uroporphyrinogen decarboxylase [Planctomycetota bacterium]